MPLCALSKPRNLLRPALILAAVFLSPAPLLADERVDWPHALTWGDFKGLVPDPVQKAETDYDTAKKAVEDLEAELDALNKKLAAKQKELKDLIEKKTNDLKGVTDKAKRNKITEASEAKTEPINTEIETLGDQINAKKAALETAKETLDKADAAYSEVDLAATFAPIKLNALVPGECGKIKEWTAKAQFRRDKSYATPDTKKGGNAALLKHEQTHFDITEKHARKLSATIKTSVDAYNAKVVELEKEKCADQKAKEEKAEKLLALYSDLKDTVAAAAQAEVNAMDKENKDYDSNPKDPPRTGTNNGKDAKNQEQWNKDVAKALQPTPAK
jgi:flagellar biosynthesis chaperone FliJ